MNETARTNEIGDLNLSYLLLAQRLVREDVASAMFRLGMSRELADLLGNLSLSQIVKLSNSSLLLCRFRFDDHPILSALTHDHKNLALQQAHTAILLSSQDVATAP
jgi:flagellar transcriptional activator FlhD